MSRFTARWRGRLHRALHMPGKLLRYYGDYRNFAQRNDGRLRLRFAERYPCLDDATGHTGFDAHYVYHTAWAARLLQEQGVTEHVDFGSCLRFVTLISASTHVTFYDYRPPQLSLHNLECRAADLTNLSAIPDASLHSLSCMHVVEHIGMGRYGDTVDPQADLRAMGELRRVSAPGGRLLFVVPVGEPCVMFNAHRIYSYAQVLAQFQGFRLREFALVTDHGEFVAQADAALADQQRYGCGCFWFERVGDDG